MKKRFSEEQIIGFLREAEAGLAAVNAVWPLNFMSDARWANYVFGR